MVEELVLFPDYLDNAKVLYYVELNTKDQLLYTDGSVASDICFYAICKYENDNKYYLFACDEKREVVSDYLLDSIEECKVCASDLTMDNNLLWNKKN